VLQLQQDPGRPPRILPVVDVKGNLGVRHGSEAGSSPDFEIIGWENNVEVRFVDVGDAATGSEPEFLPAVEDSSQEEQRPSAERTGAPDATLSTDDWDAADNWLQDTWLTNLSAYSPPSPAPSPVLSSLGHLLGRVRSGSASPLQQNHDDISVTRSSFSIPRSLRILEWELAAGPGGVSNRHGFPSTKNAGLLAYYQNTVALVPWTNPASELNSLRLIMPLVDGFQPLLHAVVALSAAHYPLGLSARLGYKSQALSTFSDAIEAAAATTADAHLDRLLATVLVLLNLQSVESGYGQWRTHLAGARHLLDARFRSHNVGQVLRRNPMLHRVVLQISWYDTMVSLLSLAPCEIPDRFSEAVVSLSVEQMQGAAHGGMLDTVGCPEAQFLTMRRMAKGEISEVDEIWKGGNTATDVRAVHSGRHHDAVDVHHTEQVWKFASVVYLLTRRRMVEDEQEERDIALLEFCTRLIMDHAQCLSSSPFHKQLNFALVVAGAQVDGPADRDFFRSYCLRHRCEIKWAVFESGLSILEETWALRDRQADQGVRPSACWSDITANHGKNQYMLG
jgi:hypothetical protein